MNIIVTAAGAGQRFRDAGYKDPKPFIKSPYRSFTILEHTLLSIPDILGFNHSDNISFAFQQKDFTEECNADINNRYVKIDKKTNDFVYPKISLFPQLTRGNLETAYITALQTRPDPDEPLLILDSDNYFDGSKFLEYITSLGRWDDTYALTCVFRPLDDSTKWGFATPYNYEWGFKDNGLVKVGNILEKDPNALAAGGWPMVGVFYFSKARLFMKAAKEILYSNTPAAGEFYMTQSLKHLLNQNIPVFALTVGDVIPLGTPEDLVKYQKSLRK